MRRDRRKIDGKIEPTSSHKKKGKGRKKKCWVGCGAFLHIFWRGSCWHGRHHRRSREGFCALLSVPISKEDERRIKVHSTFQRVRVWRFLVLRFSVGRLFTNAVRTSLLIVEWQKCEKQRASVAPKFYRFSLILRCFSSTAHLVWHSWGCQPYVWQHEETWQEIL